MEEKKKCERKENRSDRKENDCPLYCLIYGEERKLVFKEITI